VVEHTRLLASSLATATISFTQSNEALEAVVFTAFVDSDGDEGFVGSASEQLRLACTKGEWINLTLTVSEGRVEIWIQGHRVGSSGRRVKPRKAGPFLLACFGQGFGSFRDLQSTFPADGEGRKLRPRK